MLTLSSTSLTIVAVIGAIGLAALVFAFVLRRQVLAAPEGTAKMQDIAQAIQEGASAYLNRQFRTLALFAVIVFGLLFLLPGDAGIKVGRSVAFLVGAGFSACIGYLGMWLAVRANVRVAAAATRPGGRAEGARVAFRTGGVVGMSVVGLGLLGAAGVVLLYRGDAPAVLEGSGSGLHCSRCSCASEAGSSPRRRTSVRTWWARSSRGSPRMTRATRRPSRTTSGTTWGTARAWPRTSSSRTPSCSSRPSSWARPPWGSRGSSSR